MKRRDWFQWHSWLGLTSGLLLFVVCWSGTVAVFSREIDWLLNPVARAAVMEEPIAWQRAHDAVAAARPGWTITRLNAPYAPGWPVEAWVQDPGGTTHRAFLDPATGTVTAVTSYFNVQRFLRSFHMSLFIGDWQIAGVPLGYWIVCLLALVLLGSLVTSLVFYRRWWRGFFTLEWGKGPTVFWSGLHKLAGLWSLWFVLVIGSTGIWYLVEWYAPRSPAGPELPAGVQALDPPPDLDTLVAAAGAAYPALQLRALSLDGYPAAPLELHGQDGALLVRDRAARIWLDPRDGRVLGVQRAADLSPYHRWIDTADPLHFGDFAGLWSKTVWFLFGLGLSGLCLTGAWLQARRQQRARGPRTLRRPIALAYGVTVAVVLLSALSGVGEIRDYGRDLSGSPAWPDVPVGVAVFIIAWIASTLTALGIWMARLR
ncbi:MAG: hypothetical protein RLY86_196 [Pseudomonadota bacterium]|jgi:uncharacterized iron-regulated membrane protein